MSKGMSMSGLNGLNAELIALTRRLAAASEAEVADPEVADGLSRLRQALGAVKAQRERLMAERDGR